MKGIKKILLGLLLLSTTLVFSQGFTLGNRMLMGSTTPSEITLTSTSTLASWSPTNIVNPGTTLDWTVTGGVTIATTTIDDPTFDFSSNSGTANVLIENTDDLTNFTLTSLSITSADVSKAIALTKLLFSNNSLTSLDVSTNVLLTQLSVPQNSLTSLDISTNVLLTSLFCSNNSITSLDLSTNVLLSSIDTSLNSLTSLDTSTNVLLTSIQCNNNSITSLDLSTNVLLSGLFCYENSFSSTVTNQILADLVANGLNNGTLHYRNNETGQGVTDRATLITRGWSITNYGT